MNNLLENITAIEISTVIVEEIVDEMFIPWEVYQAIYYISRPNLEKSQVDLSLRDRYLQLRRQLELGYALLLIDPNSQLYNRALESEIKRDLLILAQKHGDWETISTRLPEPIPSNREQTMSAVYKLLSDRDFLNILRQLDKINTVLERRDRILRQNPSTQTDITDTIYAQTSIQLDGKIVNRYSQAILERSDLHLLLQLHQQSTAAGEEQWRGLVEFALTLVSQPLTNSFIGKIRRSFD